MAVALWGWSLVNQLSTAPPRARAAQRKAAPLLGTILCAKLSTLTNIIAVWGHRLDMASVSLRNGSVASYARFQRILKVDEFLRERSADCDFLTGTRVS